MAAPQIRRRRHGAASARAAWEHDEPFIAVDAQDNELGVVSRSTAHGEDGVLHRAFMTFLLDKDGRVLLCRRSAHKRLWPLLWADSCAGHPKPGEDTREAAKRRLAEELGCTVSLRHTGKFVYQARFANGGCECELCHVFVGRCAPWRPTRPKSPRRSCSTSSSSPRRWPSAG